MKKFTALLLLYTSLLTPPFFSKGQDSPDYPPSTDPGVDVPFDGGLSILITTAVVFGITKMKKDGEKI